ncbi:indole-3-glycerol phosphate synthase TrpC [Paenibacillus gansuensis]|uniref:Indole-3-glycerol phosphate synthase n=1 Tax=Paenibacillus gansuensis TaxID=306542 RepID=A0ABW5PCY8_9BACL
MYLDRIVATKQQEVAALSEHFNQAKVEKVISELPPCLGFHKALKEGRKRPMGLIAEIKKASPSKGLIRDEFGQVELALAYEAAGADCLSVLTDTQYFQGHNDFLTDVRLHVNVPLLRKDFIIDHTQVFEARLIGADAILLIAAILTDNQLKAYSLIAKGLGMDVLVEVHDQEELERVLTIGADLIGINNRNLRTFVTDLKTTEQLIQSIPEGTTIVSESGISTPEEVEYLQSVGAHALLIGEHFMRQQDVGQAVIDLLGPVRRGQ